MAGLSRHGPGNPMDDPNHILTLHTVHNDVIQSWALPHNKDRYVPRRRVQRAAREVTLSDTDEDSAGGMDSDENAAQLVLTFDKPPRDRRRGFVFGTDNSVCDVVLGEFIGANYISGQQFVITWDAQDRLILRDESRRGTAVGFDRQHDGLNDGGHRRNFTWLLLPRFERITVRLKRYWNSSGEGFTFALKVPAHPTTMEQYRARLRAYQEASCQTIPALDVLRMESRASMATTATRATPATPATPTRPRSPGQRPLYHRGERLGKGGFGTVFKVMDVSTGDIYAAKEFDKKDDWEEEVQMMRRVVHEHIVPFVGDEEDPLPTLIIGYMPGGSLASQHRQERFSREELTVIAWQAFRALAYLHSQGIAHRDLSPGNILLQSRKPTLHIRLADFGLSKNAASLKTYVGTAPYIAPEVHEMADGAPHYTSAVDVWSLAVVLLQLIAGFPNSRTDGVAWCQAVVRHAQALVQREPDDAVHVFLRDMLRMEASNRPSIAQCFGRALILFEQFRLLSPLAPDLAPLNQTASLGASARERQPWDPQEDTPTDEDELSGEESDELADDPRGPQGPKRRRSPSQSVSAVSSSRRHRGKRAHMMRMQSNLAGPATGASNPPDDPVRDSPTDSLASDSYGPGRPFGVTYPSDLQDMTKISGCSPPPEQ